MLKQNSPLISLLIVSRAYLRVLPFPVNPGIGDFIAIEVTWPRGVTRGRPVATGLSSNSNGRAKGHAESLMRRPDTVAAASTRRAAIATCNLSMWDAPYGAGRPG